MPEGARFAEKEPYRYPNDALGQPMRSVNDKSREEVRTGFDALFALDPSRRAKSSVLVRGKAPFLGREN